MSRASISVHKRLVLGGLFILMFTVIGFTPWWLVGEATVLVYTVLFLLVPTLIIYTSNQNTIRPSLSAGIVLGLGFGPAMLYISTQGAAWTIDHTILLWPDVLGGLIYLEELIWFVVWIMLIVALYEYCFDHKTNQQHLWSHQASIMLIGWAIAGTLYISDVYLGWVSSLSHPYLLIVGGALLPLGYVLFRKWSSLGMKVLALVPIFTILHLVNEYVALELGWISFNSNYVLVIDFIGHSLPLEELVAWIVLGASGVAAYHELLIDDAQ